MNQTLVPWTGFVKDLGIKKPSEPTEVRLNDRGWTDRVVAEIAAI